MAPRPISDTSLGKNKKKIPNINFNYFDLSITLSDNILFEIKQKASITYFLSHHRPKFCRNNLILNAIKIDEPEDMMLDTVCYEIYDYFYKWYFCNLCRYFETKPVEFVGQETWIVIFEGTVGKQAWTWKRMTRKSKPFRLRKNKGNLLFHISFTENYVVTLTCEWFRVCSCPTFTWSNEHHFYFWEIFMFFLC